MKNTITIIPWNLKTFCAICGIIFLSSACNTETKTNEADSNSEEAEMYTIVEELPQPEGGLGSFYNYVQNEISYPLLARKNGIEGRVFVEFVVERDGSLSGIKAIKGINDECDNEAVRVMQSASAFKPGKQRGRTVRVRMVLPITFKLDPENTNEDKSPKGIIIVGEIMYINEQMKVDASYTNGMWSGTILTQEGEPLPGAHIVVKGTTSGTVSDLDGTFSIEVQESQELVVSFVGYETKVLKR
jgi:TonB family protein